MNTEQKSPIPAIVDFPTPPFADETATTFFTSRILRCCGSPLCIRGICGGAPERGRPYMTLATLLKFYCLLITRGFSCCKHLNVENNRGFMLACCCRVRARCSFAGDVVGKWVSPNGRGHPGRLKNFCCGRHLRDRSYGRPENAKIAGAADC